MNYPNRLLRVCLQTVSTKRETCFIEEYSQTCVQRPPWDPKIVAFVDRWSLFEGNLCNKSSKCDIEMVVVSLGLTVNPNLIQFSSFVQILNLRLDHNFGQNVECY